VTGKLHAARSGSRKFSCLYLLMIGFALSACGHRNATSHGTSNTPQPSVSSASSRTKTQTQLPPATPGEYVEQGTASWYGAPFNGHRSADGEIYDMNQPTAAHRTLPFNSMVRVTNLNNGLQTTVRVTDRGPFVQGRIIDLSYAAAQSISMIGTGTAPVRLELISGTDPYTGNFSVQVGAFRVQENAQRLQARLQQEYGLAMIQTYDSPDGIFYRVRVGRLPSLAAAQQFAAQLHSADFQTFVVRLDDQE
jgi:rare lipoprotein A